MEFICLFENFLSEILVVLQKNYSRQQSLGDGLKRSRFVKSGYGFVKSGYGSETRSYGSGTLVIIAFFSLLYSLYLLPVSTHPPPPFRPPFCNIKIYPDNANRVVRTASSLERARDTSAFSSTAICIRLGCGLPRLHHIHVDVSIMVRKQFLHPFRS